MSLTAIMQPPAQRQALERDSELRWYISRIAEEAGMDFSVGGSFTLVDSGDYYTVERPR